MNPRRNFIKTAFQLMPLVLAPKLIFRKSVDDLPKVLIIGDSISIGYLPFVRALMKDKAMVTRPYKANGKPENCQGTTNGVLNIDKWIGDTKWDVIHFNFGLHDLKHVEADSGKNSNSYKDPHQADRKQYKKNMEEIVAKLKATGAKLIFATTTPYPDTVSKPARKPGMSKKYNRVALKVMKKSGIPINDLYSFMLPKMKDLQRPNNVHFTEMGSKALAQQVANAIFDKINKR